MIHLEQEKEKILRGIGPTAINSKKTHCKRNHELANENLIVGKNGNRECKTCKILRRKGVI